MQLKQTENVKKKKKKEKDKTKVKAQFPQAPPEQFYNCFGEAVTSNDILYAFEFVNTHNDMKITIDEMKNACKKFDLANPENLFGHLDVNNNGYVRYRDWKQALSKRKSKLRMFWQCVLGGKHLEGRKHFKGKNCSITQVNEILKNTSNNQNVRVIALHSITRKMCVELRKDKSDQLFTKCIDNVLAQLG
eukprot:69517_1